MKLFRYITALVMGLVAFTACETDPTDLASKDAVAPVMDEHAAILMTPNTPDETVTFTWKAARNLEGTVNYFLYAELNGQEVELAKTEAIFFTARKSALRQQLLAGFNLEGNENFDLNIYVVADNGVQALKSASQLVKVYVYGDYVPAQVTIPETIPAEGLVLTDKTPEEQTLLVWEPARFENGQTVTYRVELDMGGGARIELANRLEATEYKTTWPKLNSMLLKNGFEKDKEYELSFLVTAISESTPDFDGEWLESEPVKLKVTTYTPAFPDFLYVIGDFCGHDGLNTLEKAPILKGDANEGVYHGIVTIYGGKFQFYYINPRTVNDPEPKKMFVGGTTENTGAPYYWKSVLNAEGNELAPQDGTYAFYVNLSEEYIRAVQINSVGLIGEKGLINSIAEDWGKEAQFTFNEATFCYELNAKFSKSEGKYKVRLNNNWNKPFAELNGGSDVGEPGYNFGQEKGVQHDPTTLVKLAWDQDGEDIVSAAGEYKVVIDFSTNANYSLQFTQTGVVNEYGLSGDYNQWGADGKDKKFGADLEQEGWYVLKDFVVTEGQQMIVRMNDSDAEQWGMAAAGQTMEADKTYTLKAGGEKFSLATGTYDVFFNPETLEFYATQAGAYYGLCGEHNSWGATADPQFVKAADKEGWLVLKGFAATAGKQAKIRKNDQWADNWGLPGAEIAVGEQYTLQYNMDNFKWAATGVYDIYFNPTTLALYIEEGTAIVYGLVGDLNGWNPADETFAMADNGNGYKVIKGVKMDAGNFKVIEVGSWDNPDYGMPEGATLVLGEPVTLAVDGAGGNIAVGSGTYDIYFNPSTLVLYVVEAGAEDPTATPSTPAEPEYSLYGAFNYAVNWEDTDMVKAENGYYKALGVVVGADNFEFLIRTNHAWDEKFGKGEVIEIGVATTLVVGGENMKIATAGTYDFYFNPTKKELYIMTAGADDPTATPEASAIYGLVGQHNAWGASADTPFAEYENGYFKATQALVANDPFKIRAFGQWVDTANYGVDGAPDSTNPVAVSESFTLVNGPASRNMCVTADGTYDIYFNPTALKCLIVAEGETPNFGGTTPEQPETKPVYGLVGQHNAWGGSADTPFVEYAAKAGYFKATQALVANDPFKIRSFGKWDDTVNYGVDGAPDSTNPVALGESFALVNGAGSRNMCVTADGTYDIYFNPTALKCLIVAEGTTPNFGTDTPVATTPYSIAGTMNNWSNTDKTYTFEAQSNGKLLLKAVKFAYAGEFKVLQNYNWNTSFGGTLKNGVVALSATGSNIAIAAGIYDMELDMASMKLTVTKVADVEQQSDFYILAGTHNNWNPSDQNCKFADAGNGLLVLKNITFGAGGKFKVVKNQTWCGGVLSNGIGTLNIGGGDNFSIAAGTYDFYINPTAKKVQAVAAGAAPSI